jgi:DNA (cytosine-5)-methyltransferase 1
MSIRHQIFGTDFGFVIPCLNEFEELGFRKRKRLLTEQYQEKAKLAISKLKNNPLEISPTSHRYFATLSDKFDFKTSEKESSDFYISIEWSNNLKITIHDSTMISPANYNECFFSIRVSPECENWGLSVDEIQVDCFSSKPLSYTLAWKSIENELIRNNIKADLVQLCGYYQYAPKIKCALIHADDNEHISFLANVVNGNVTRRMISVDSLADEWNISSDEVLEYAQQMRRLGYEIRNSHTNPQIEQNQWLIPYAFPTLTPQSVQLRKSLAR